MKIYLAVSIRGGRDLLDVYKYIVKYLDNQGHDVLNRHVILDNVLSREDTLSPQEIYRRDMDWLQESDIVIGEASVQSLGAGYELGRAVELQKPISILFNREKENAVSMMIRGNPSIQIFKYNSIEDIDDILEKILNK